MAKPRREVKYAAAAEKQMLEIWRAYEQSPEMLDAVSEALVEIDDTLAERPFAVGFSLTDDPDWEGDSRSGPYGLIPQRIDDARWMLSSNGILSVIYAIAEKEQLVTVVELRMAHPLS